MPSASLRKSSTPVSTLSSLATTDTTRTTATAAQSGRYTKAQFQSTVEGCRSVKNTSEVEQLLHDYPAALELYRTGRYKVKVKYEADVERVILVEKRVSKNVSNPAIETNGVQQNNPPVSNGSANIVQAKEDIRNDHKSTPSITRTHSRDRLTSGTSGTDDNAVVQTTGTSFRMPSNSQPKVDHYPTLSKELKASPTPQPKQKHREHRRSHPRDGSSNGSHHKQKGKKSNRDYTNALVPCVPRAHHTGNTWHPSRALQPYYSYPTLQQRQEQPNYYMPPTYAPQQNAYYPQPYYNGQQPPLAVTYQKPYDYPTATPMNSKGKTVHPHNIYPPTSWKAYNSNHSSTAPTSYQPFQPNHQQYPFSNPIYQPQIPWPPAAHSSTRPFINNSHHHADNRRDSKHRTRSVDTGPQSQPPVDHTNSQKQHPALPPAEYHHHHHHHQQHPALPPAEYHHHHHHHQQHRYHHQPHPTNGQVINIPPPVQTARNQNAPLKETVTKGNNNEKLTIRQLNGVFLQTDPSGRLPYSSVPNILQRFGVSLGENDLMSAAQSLEYNVNEPITARRLVHVLMKLGKIAKSTHHQAPPQQHQPQPQSVSPTILPEDREVIDIMAQHRTSGTASTHLHSSTYPNYWH